MSDYAVQVTGDGPPVMGDEGVIYVIDREQVVGRVGLIRLNKLLSEALDRLETRFQAATEEILRLRREKDERERAGG